MNPCPRAKGIIIANGKIINQCRVISKQNGITYGKASNCLREGIIATWMKGMAFENPNHGEGSSF
jgi:hypothetical protein